MIGSVKLQSRIPAWSPLVAFFLIVASATAPLAWAGRNTELGIAQYGLARFPGATPWEKLARAFEAGVAPDLGARRGWWTGRWFSEAEPMKPRGSLLAIANRKSSGVGPGFAFSPLLIQLGDLNRPEAFDEVTGAIRGQVHGTLQYQMSRTTLVSLVNGSVTFEVRDDRGATAWRYSVRQLGDYLVLKYEFVKVTPAGHASYAYYFKKVGP